MQRVSGLALYFDLGATSNGIISAITILLATNESLTVRVECDIGVINPTIEIVAAFNLTVAGKMRFVLHLIRITVETVWLSDRSGRLQCFYVVKLLQIFEV